MDPVDFVRLKLSKLFRGKADRKISLPVGVVEMEGRILILLQNRVTPGLIDAAQNDDDFSFSLNSASYELPVQYKNTYLGTVSAFAHEGSNYLLCKNRKGIFLGSIEGKNISLREVKGINEKSVVAGDFTHGGRSVAYTGERAIRIAYSDDLEAWEVKQKPLLVDSAPLEAGGVFATDNGLLLLYFKKEIQNGHVNRSAYFALFDKRDPDKLIWKMTTPAWRQSDHWKGKDAHHLGTLMHNRRLVSYWNVEDKGIYAVSLSGLRFDPTSVISKIQLKKHETNPIISPKPENSWEAFNTFNPAAVYADKKVHILYRAQGYDYLSTVGYASSRDGIHIHDRLNEPVYTPQMDFENNDKKDAVHDFMSGGGIGGCEDPRITLMEDRIYMTYVAFDGWSPPRLALTSIALDDFLDKRWLWSKPVLISPPGIIDKSGCILPEKINGKYVFFHRVFPNILIDFVDDLNFDGKTTWLKGQYQIKIRDNMWDSRKIGAGAPPLKTKDGWLLIYYGVDDKDASKYHIGAMLLDLKDPTKVLHRSNKPILSPVDDYENNGFKPGIAYPCGAVIIKDSLFVYYGGADSVVCVATARLDTFLEELKSKESARLENIQIQEVDY